MKLLSLSNIDYLIDKSFGTVNNQLFYRIRLITSLIIFGCFILLPYGYLISPIITYIYFMWLNYYFVIKNINELNNKIELQAIIFFDIMFKLMDGGMSSIEALEITCFNTKGELSKSLKKMLLEYKYGIDINECLNNFNKIMPSTIVYSIIYNVILENNYEGQLEYLKNENNIRIKRELSSINGKIISISIIFITLLSVLIIYSPMIIVLLGFGG